MEPPQYNDHASKSLSSSNKVYPENDSLYRQIFEHTNVIKLIIAAHTLQVIEANPAACAFYGYTAAQIESMHLYDISILTELQLQAAIRNVITGTQTTFETRHRLASGVIRDVRVHAGFLTAGDKDYLFAEVEDITARKLVENALRESEKLYRLFAHNMPDSSVIMFDREMRYTLAEGPFLKRFGTMARSTVGKLPHETTLTQETLAFIIPIYQRALQGETFSYERETLEYAYQAHVAPVRDINGAIIGGMILCHDITQRKQLENDVRASEEHLRLITDNMQDLITESDAEERIVYTSPSSRTLLGREPEDMTGHFRDEFAHPEDWGHMLAVRKQMIEAGLQHGVLGGRLRHADGHYIDVETVARFLYDSDSMYIGGIFVTRDVTERKQMESLSLEKQMLQTSLEKEQELHSLKTRMMERIAHEFRTPLAVIQTTSELFALYHDQMPEEQWLSKNKLVKKQIKHITSMLDEISLVVRSTYRQDHLFYIRTDLCALCRDIAEHLVTALDLPNKYQFELPDKLKAPIDPNAMRDSLTHIMRNAARFSEPADPVTIRIAQTGESIELRVIDHGIGIPPDELPRIFDPFFRGSNIDERGGLGVGLSIARAAIEAHGGTIRVESELHTGTTVIITLHG